ncbi:barstar family protein [Actinoplanes sp. CA-252034]|uniref:barstar family protein n=1 Tax=Actinoplanes sp. CA-252034 TaxID=3239906 RepID=UPI003D95DC46
MSIPFRWRLSDVTTDDPVTECMEIDGLFTDLTFPVEPVYERHILQGCEPSGRLRAVIDGGEPSWFGNLVLEAPEAWSPVETLESLLDVRVVGHRPAADGSGRLDIEIEGHREPDTANAGGTVAPGVPKWLLFDGDTPVGECRAVAGLFHERPPIWPPGPPVTLRGCRTGPTGFVEAEVSHVRVDGTVHDLYWEQRIVGRVRSTEPSALGDGLVDVALDARVPSPLAANERQLWDMWRAGGPTEPNQWAGLDRSGRYLWVRAAAVHRVRAPDKPDGTVYHLDGRHVTDYDGFYCAIGEAINGPGGWFGGDLFWLHENAATGDGGATPGFRLIWHDSEVARRHLVAGYDRKSWTAAVTFDELVAYLTGEGVRVELR